MRRWKVDTHAKMDSILMLSSVNLPGGELVSNFHMYHRIFWFEKNNFYIPLPACVLLTVWDQIRPDKTSDLI